MDKKLYQTLVEQFVIYDQEDLKEILSDNESSEEAIAAAKYILSAKNGRTVALRSGSTSPVYINGKLCRSYKRGDFANDNFELRGIIHSNRNLRWSRIYAWKRCQ